MRFSNSCPLPLLSLSLLSSFLLPTTALSPLANDPSPKQHTTHLDYLLHPNSTPHPLATLTHLTPSPNSNTNSATQNTISSFTPPPNSTTNPHSLTSILLYLPDSSGAIDKSRYRSTATATIGFHAPYKGRFRLVVSPKGEVLSASWHSYLVVEKGGMEGREREGAFEVLVQKMAPEVVLERGAKGKGGAMGAAGGGGGGMGEEGEGEVEKTFFQKYWWLLIGMVVLLATSGGGGE